MIIAISGISQLRKKIITINENKNIKRSFDKFPMCFGKRFIANSYYREIFKHGNTEFFRNESKIIGDDMNTDCMAIAYFDYFIKPRKFLNWKCITITSLIFFEITICSKSSILPINSVWDDSFGEVIQITGEFVGKCLDSLSLNYKKFLATLP
ncbi:MAG: hypothetical protein MZV64_62020 [Ignavibacteriales bacterium]|nr:hypothetical protein [Ignavibacteriales bacterium]